MGGVMSGVERGVRNLAPPTFFEKFERLFEGQYGYREEPDDLVDCVQVGKSASIWSVREKLRNHGLRAGPTHCNLWIDGVVGWYSVESAEEFKAMKEILHKYELICHAYGTPMMVVGVRPADESQRQVSFDAGLKFARKHKALFYEIDEDRDAAKDVIYEMIRCMKQPRKQSCYLVRYVV